MMTGSAFLKRLKFKLDFLSAEDKKTVLAYYEKKLKEAKNKDEEESIVKSFGAPESVAKELRKTFFQKKETPSTDGDASVFPPEADTVEPSPEDSEEAVRSTATESEENETKDASDLIFSKPAAHKASPEFIQSLENKEIPTLYGEKVVIKDRETPIEEIPLEPIDEENGLTPEEIKLAKEKTLEKAQSFDNEDPAQVAPDEPNGDAEAQRPEPVELDPEEAPQVKEFPGIFKRMFEKSSLSPKAVSALTLLLSILVSPLLLLAFGAGLLVYAALSFVVLGVALLAFALIATLVVCGVVELIYGCALLFDSVPVALIELGLGTVLFSLVTAISALVYEFLFGIVPKILKFLTVKFKRYMLMLYCYLYGGVA